MQFKKFIATILTLLITLIVSFPSAAFADEINTGSLTIQQALDIAYAKNPDIRQADLSLQSAQINRDDAAEVIDYLPVAGLVNSATYQVVNTYQTAQINLDTAKKNKSAVKDSVACNVISAYAQAIRDRNNLDTALLTMENLKDQQKVISLSNALGLTADLDYGQFLTSLKKTEQSYKDAQLAYASSTASLAALLGQNEGWNPQLSSSPILESYTRDELSLELSRTISQSVLLMQTSTQLEIQKSKQDWILPNLTSEMQNINVGLAEVNYDKALNSARTQLEQLYYNIDAVEGSIQASEITYQQDLRNLETAQLQYDVGLIPRISASTTASFAAAKLTVEKDKLALDSSRAALAKLKAQFAYLTGHEVYQAEDWAEK